MVRDSFNVYPRILRINSYINQKYVDSDGNPDSSGTHHYEIDQTSGKTSTKSNTYKTAINPFCVKLASGVTDEEAELAKEKGAYLELTDNRGNPYTRKVVMSTNVAESSITVDGVVYVIDAGYEFSDSYYPKEMMGSLLEEIIPQSSALQRRGRCGRVEPGTCYHLYSESDFKKCDKYPFWFLLLEK